MAPLTILSDDNVKDLLYNLTKEEVQAIQKSLRTSLHEYSTAAQDQPECAANQPERLSMQHPNGTVTLIMPSKASSGLAVKGLAPSVPCIEITADLQAVVTLTAPQEDPESEEEDKEYTLPKAGTIPQGGLTLMGTDGRPFGFMNAEELTAFRTALASSLLIVRRRKVKNITVFGTGKQACVSRPIAMVL